MTNEEFSKRLSQKCIDELACERVRSVLTNKQSTDVLFRKYYDFFEADDLNVIKRVFKEAITVIQSSGVKEELPQEHELLQLYCFFATAKDSMRDLVIMMCHEMRDEYDYAGLTELHDALLKLPYDLYHPLSFLVFNDLYDCEVCSHEDGSWYQMLGKTLENHFSELRQRADNEWANCQAAASDDSDFMPRELTVEYLHELWARNSATEDILLISTVEKREMMMLAYVMLIEKILRSIVLDCVNKMRMENDYNALANMMRTIDQIDGLSAARREKCVSLLMSKADN